VDVQGPPDALLLSSIEYRDAVPLKLHWGGDPTFGGFLDVGVTGRHYLDGNDRTLEKKPRLL
jgi:hypothetical protein